MPMSLLQALALLVLQSYLSLGNRVEVGDSISDDSIGGDCSWARFDESSGWRCETLQTLMGGMTSNTKVVMLTPPSNQAFNQPFKAVLKAQNSNDNPQGLEFLENEREMVDYLQQQRYAYMPRYFLSGINVQSKYRKYKKPLTLIQKNACDESGQWLGECQINPDWAKCNEAKCSGNCDTKKLMTAKERMQKGLDCPDTQVLAIEYLDGYMDLPHLHPHLQQEGAFAREVRAAALFVAYDNLRSIGVSHCDFNNGNAMFNKNDPSDAKIIDFGLSRRGESPVGRCTGRLADLGPVSGGPAPGHLWFALYRGAVQEADYQSYLRPGPLSLSTHNSFQNPVTGATMDSFTQMAAGKWAMAPAQYWPQIVQYARELLALYSQSKGPVPKKQQVKYANEDAVQQPARKIQQEPQKIQRNLAPFTRAVQEPKEPAVKVHRQQHERVESSLPVCKHVTFDVVREMFAPCKLTLLDQNKCLMKLECNNRNGKKKYVNQELSRERSIMGGRIEIDDCQNCKQV